LDRGLDIIVKLVATSKDSKYKGAFKKFSANNLNLTSVAKIKDLAPSSPYYTSVESLKERYGIDLVDKDGRFKPEQPVTEKELQYWLNGVFSTDEISSNLKKPNIDRGQFVMKFNGTLDRINMRIGIYMSELK
jgi:S-layer homology domain